MKGKIEGAIEGEVKMIRILQSLLESPVTGESELSRFNLEQLQTITNDLKEKLQNRRRDQ